MKPRAQDSEHAPAVLRRRLAWAEVVPRRGARRIDFIAAYRLSALDWINLVRSGLPTSTLTRTSQAMGLSLSTLCKFLNIAMPITAPATARKNRLTSDVSERLLYLHRMIGYIETMVSESGYPDVFNAAEWLGRWLCLPLPALEGRTPGAFMDTVTGQTLLSELLSRAQSGAYS